MIQCNNVLMFQCSNDTMYQCSMMISIPSGSTTAADNKASDGPRPGDVTKLAGLCTNVPMFLCSNVPMIRCTNVIMMISIPSGSTTAADNKASDGPRPGDVTELAGLCTNVPMFLCSNDTMYQRSNDDIYT